MIFSRLSSLILLFQRSPLVKILFPEVKIIGSAGMGEITKWTVTTVVGLGAYDSVSGATNSVTQAAPLAGNSNVPTAAGSVLVFVVQYVDSNAANSPNRFEITAGTLPPGVTGPNSVSGQPRLRSISGVPTTPGNYPITVTAFKDTTPESPRVSANFTIRVEPAIITTQPASVAIASGGTTTLSVVGSVGISGSGPLTYQWYSGNSPTTTSPISGATSNTFTTPALNSPASYWVRVIRPELYGPVATNVPANSNTATVSIATAPAITFQPASSSINSGETASLASTASGSPISIQWFQGNSGDTSNPVPSANSFTFTTPPLTMTTSYWMRASNAAGTANSTTATVTVNSPAVPPYDFWKAAIFTTAEAADPLISAPAADPDGDGISNQNEFILGTAPKTSGTVPNAIVSVTDNQLSVNFTAAAATGAGYMNQTRRYTLESNSSLDGTWTNVSGFADIVGAGQTVSYTSPVGPTAQFFRLRVSIAP